MTRVEIINGYIYKRFIYEEIPIRKIRTELLTYGVDLSLAELLTIITTFQYKEVKPRKRTALSERRIAFKKILEPLIRVASECFITNKNLAKYLVWKNIKHPNGKEFTQRRLENIITELEFDIPRYTHGGHRKDTPTDIQLYSLIEEKLKTFELKAIEDWVNNANV